MDHLQSLQLAVHGWAEYLLPLRLTSLRLEVKDYVAFDQHSTIGGISPLTSLEKLCLDDFDRLGDWPAEVAVALRPLHRLQALALDYCNLTENPAVDILTRLTLLSLYGNELNALPNALPADSVYNLRVLDISNNPMLSQQPAGGIVPWAAENILAFARGWASLQVLGIQNMCTSRKDTGLRATARVVQRLLQQQADAAEPRRLPATVVCDMMHEQLLRPARELAVVT